METVQLKKGKLEVSVNVFGAESRDSFRFDGACRVASIKYDGVSICRPEQVIKTYCHINANDVKAAMERF